MKRNILYSVIYWKSYVSYFNMSDTFAATYPYSIYYWIWNIFLIDKSVFKGNEDRTIYKPLFIPTSNILYHLQTSATFLQWGQCPCFSYAVKWTNVTEWWCDAELFQIYRPGFESCPILLLCPTHTFSSCEFTVCLLCSTYCTGSRKMMLILPMVLLWGEKTTPLVTSLHLLLHYISSTMGTPKVSHLSLFYSQLVTW